MYRFPKIALLITLLFKNKSLLQLILKCVFISYVSTLGNRNAAQKYPKLKGNSNGHEKMSRDWPIEWLLRVDGLENLYVLIFVIYIDLGRTKILDWEKWLL